MSTDRWRSTTVGCVCAVAAAACAGSSPVEAFPGHPFESAITEADIHSNPPPAPGSFQPSGVAVDTALSSPSYGDLYVVDGGNDVVDKFNAAHEYEKQITGFQEPFGVAVDSTGDVYVVDTGKGVIDKFDPAGTFVAGSGGPSSPFISGTPGGPFGQATGVAVDSTGDVYVVDTGKGVIDKFDPAGTFVAGSGGPSSPFISGTPGGPFGQATGVAVDSAGNIYVADGGGQAVDKFDSSGSFVAGSSGPSSAFLTFAGRPRAIAIDNSTSSTDPAAGDIYVDESTGASFGPPHRVYAFDAAGSFLSEVSVENGNEEVEEYSYPYGVAVDANGRLYVSDRSEHHRVDLFRTVVVPDVAVAAPSNIQPTSATINGELNPQGLAVSTCKFEYGTSASYGTKVACAQTPAEIGSGTTGVPVSAEIGGLTPDTTYYFRLTARNENGVNRSRGGTFVTHGPPTIEESWSSEVSKTSGVVNAQLNPHGFDTTYHFEYGTTTSYGATAPVPDGDAGEGAKDTHVNVGLTKLLPGVTYHYRVVAINSAGPAVDGPDETFTTMPPLRIDAVDATEISFGGATLNAYIDTLGSLDTRYRFEYGVNATYGTSVPMPDGNVGSGNGDQLVQATIAGLAPGTTYHFRVVGENSLGEAASPDAVLSTLPASCPNEPFRTSFSATLPECRVYEMVSPPYKADYGVVSLTLGVAPGGERVIFESLGAFAGARSDVLTIPYLSRRDPVNGWMTTSIEPPPTGDRIPALFYDVTPDLTKSLTVMVSQEPGVKNRTALLRGNFSAADVEFTQVWPLPDANVSIPEHSTTMSGVSTDLSHAVFAQAVGAHVGLEELVGLGGSQPNLLSVGGSNANAELSRGEHPISADGSKIFFEKTLVRINDAKTFTLPGEFLGASADGGTVFVRDENGGLLVTRIKSEAKNESVGETVTVTPGAEATVIRTSDDGSRVYFSSGGVFAGLNAQGRLPVPGESNVYVYDTVSHQTKFIATAEVAKAENQQYEAQATPDGRYLVFDTGARLTPDDTDSALDVYRYDAETGGLTRISVGEKGFENNGNEPADAVVAAPEELTDGRTLYQWRLDTRAISDDGSTIAFSSVGPLSPNAVNPGRADIYVWHDGQVGLVSTGRSLTSDETPVVSATGHDIFFLTSQSILPQDSDGLPDVYDARIDGGFEAPPVPVGGCSGDSCQGPPSVASLLSPPASATFSGAGNPPPPSPAPSHSCKRGKRLDKHHKCVRPRRKRSKRFGVKRTSAKSGRGRRS
jgi:sugar lactone lactonase YvrE